MRAFKTGILMASALLFVGALNFISSSEQDLTAINNCQQKQTTTTDTAVSACLKIADESSWSSWITGDSRSAQFHYLDLLELLTSSGDSKKLPSLKPSF